MKVISIDQAMLSLKIIETKRIFSNILKERMCVPKKDYTVEIVSDSTKWDVILRQIGTYDFYHTFDYHQLSKKENEEAVLFVFTQNTSLVAIPFLIRPIKDSEYYDITSAYGYVGPVSRNIPSNWDNTMFTKELSTFFKAYKIVSVFSSLNPFIKQHDVVLKGLGEFKTLGPIVNIDLKQSIHKQRENYSKITKRYLNKADKLLSLKISSAKEDVLKCIELYYQNMMRVNATKKYYFDINYFFTLINSEGFETDVIHAVLNETGEIVSSAIMVRTNNKIVQYHISGTIEDYLELSPVRFLIDKMRIMAAEQGYEYFNLGGGLGNREDSLFQFKSTFSKDFKDFRIWKLICNRQIYDELVAKKKINTGSEDSFFPSYRRSI